MKHVLRPDDKAEKAVGQPSTMPAIRVKPSVKQGKTDAAVICESGTGPASRIVPVKSPDQQAPDCGTKSGIPWHVGANMQINAL